MLEKIILARHASCGDGCDTHLTDIGLEQAVKLGLFIKKELICPEITIWTSEKIRAIETAKFIEKILHLRNEDVKINLVAKEKLFSNGLNLPDIPWLKKEIDNFSGEMLIIISHLEYVRDYLGFGSQKESKNGCGIIIYPEKNYFTNFEI